MKDEILKLIELSKHVDMYNFEQLTLIEGNIKGFKHLFPDVAITEEK